MIRATFISRGSIVNRKDVIGVTPTYEFRLVERKPIAKPHSLVAIRRIKVTVRDVLFRVAAHRDEGIDCAKPAENTKVRGFQLPNTRRHPFQRLETSIQLKRLPRDESGTQHPHLGAGELVNVPH